MVGKTAAGPQAEPEIVVSPEDVEFIRTIALAGLNLLDRVEVQIICNAINEINEPLLKEKTDVYLRTREITEADERIVGDSAAALAVKYPIITRYAPEGALIGWGIQHFAKFQSVVAEIKRVGAQIIQARKNGPPADAN